MPLGGEKLYRRPEESEVSELEKKRDAFAEQWEDLSKIPTENLTKATSNVWYKFFILKYFLENPNTSSEDIHDAMWNEIGESLNEHLFWHYLSLIERFEVKPEKETK